MSKIVFVFALLNLVLPGGAYGSVYEELRSQPASLLDVGMVRLEILTMEFERRVGLSWTGADGTKERFFAEVNSEYEPVDATIYVYLAIANGDASRKQMEEGCGYAIGQLGIWLGKSLPRFFSPVGSIDHSRTEELHDELGANVILRCYVHSPRNSSVGRFWASRSLGDRELTIGPW